MARKAANHNLPAAIRSASGNPVEEGVVGAETGTLTRGFKGGVGTASRVDEQMHREPLQLRLLGAAAIGLTSG